MFKLLRIVAILLASILVEGCVLPINSTLRDIRNQLGSTPPLYITDFLDLGDLKIPKTSHQGNAGNLGPVPMRAVHKPTTANVRSPHNEALMDLDRYYLYLREGAHAYGAKYIDDPWGVITSPDLGSLTFTSGSPSFDLSGLVSVLKLATPQSGSSTVIQGVSARVFHFSGMASALYEFSVKTLASVLQTNKDVIANNPAIQQYVDLVSGQLQAWSDTLPVAECELHRIASLSRPEEISSGQIDQQVALDVNRLNDMDSEAPCYPLIPAEKPVVSSSAFEQCPEVAVDTTGKLGDAKGANWYAAIQVWTDPDGAFIYGNGQFLGMGTQASPLMVYVSICGDQEHGGKDSWSYSYKVTAYKSGFSDRIFPLQIQMYQDVETARGKPQKFPIALQKTTPNAATPPP